MAQVTINIGGINYPIACDDGQEEHLAALAEKVDRRVNELAAAVGKVGEARLLVLAALLMADELDDSLRECKQLRHAMDRDRGAAQRAADEDAAAHAIEKVAGRIEGIVARLEGA